MNIKVYLIVFERGKNRRKNTHIYVCVCVCISKRLPKNHFSMWLHKCLSESMQRMLLAWNCTYHKCFWLSWLRFGVIYMFEVKTNEAKRCKENEKGTVHVHTYVFLCVFARSAPKRKDTRRFRQFNKQFYLICYCMYVCASSSSSSHANKCFGTHTVRNCMWNDTQPGDTCNRENIDIKRKMKFRQHKKGMECKQTFLYITLICTRKCMWKIFYISARLFLLSRVKCFELLAIQTSSSKKPSVDMRANFSWYLCANLIPKNWH